MIYDVKRVYVNMNKPTTWTGWTGWTGFFKI